MGYKFGCKIQLSLRRMQTVNFENTEVAFSHKDNRKLNQSYWLFRIIGSPFMVKLGAFMVNTALTLRVPFGWMIRKNIFAQFCGGTNIQESLKSAEILAQSQVGSILDYSVEGKEDESDFEKTTLEIIATIEAAKDKSFIPFSVFKITGVCQFSLLEKVNAGQSLSEIENASWVAAQERVHRICFEAHQRGVALFIDAEDSWIQDAIDRLVENMMLEFNTKSPIVYQTVQLYRHDRLNYLKQLHNKLKSNSCVTAVKLVRGAYMEKERKRAAELNYTDPIQPTKEATDRDFNAAIAYALDHISDFAICCGSHNEESSLMLALEMEKRGIERSDKRVFFAQLFGMSDHISYNLSHAGYNVAKYLPYGPIKEVMPYLLRRAQENTSVKGQTGRELSLILKEKQRRKLG
jgi:proline dehydrogenase